MRIAIIAPPWVPVPPPRYGGTEAVIDLLARGLELAGHEVLLFTTGDSTCPVSRAWALPTAAGTVNVGPATELRHVINAYGVVTAWGAQVVHDHTLIGPIYSSRFRLPVVTTNHGPFDGELADAYEAIGREVPVIAISHTQASAAGRTPIAAVIHHGVDVDSFPHGSGDGGYALFLGRMSPDKGVHVAARVARAAGLPLKIAAKLVEPAEREYFRERVEPLLGGDVEYIGEVGGAEKLRLLAGAACLLNPVAWPEPFGMVMIEALACGTPVVGTPMGSVPEIVQDGVTGFVRDTETDLADALLRVPDLNRGDCRKAAALRFSVERMVSEHLDVYSAALEAGRAPSQVA